MNPVVVETFCRQGAFATLFPLVNAPGGESGTEELRWNRFAQIVEVCVRIQSSPELIYDVENKWGGDLVAKIGSQSIFDLFAAILKPADGPKAPSCEHFHEALAGMGFVGALRKGLEKPTRRLYDLIYLTQAAEHFRGEVTGQEFFTAVVESIEKAEAEGVVGWVPQLNSYWKVVAKLVRPETAKCKALQTQLEPAVKTIGAGETEYEGWWEHVLNVLTEVTEKDDNLVKELDLPGVFSGFFQRADGAGFLLKALARFIEGAGATGVGKQVIEAVGWILQSWLNDFGKDDDPLPHHILGFVCQAPDVFELKGDAKKVQVRALEASVQNSKGKQYGGRLPETEAPKDPLEGLTLDELNMLLSMLAQVQS